jgi:hypothetical protein
MACTRHRLFILLLGLVLGLPAAAAPPAAQEASLPAPADEAAAEKTGGAATPAKQPATKFACIVCERPGRPGLMIEYPWKLHAHSSVEVRYATAAQEKEITFAPIYFVAEYFKGANRDHIYHCLDTVSDRVERFTFTKDQVDFHVSGLKNLLGHPAVQVVAKEVGRHTKAAPIVIFPLLDGWAIDDKMLSFDLPADEFAAPGTLHVWFLRGDTAMWEQSLAWPGSGAVVTPVNTDKDTKVKGVKKPDDTGDEK